nr:hypothetical protein JVH1_3980 [Rhodococcus sp. JVH1]
MAPGNHESDVQAALWQISRRITLDPSQSRRCRGSMPRPDDGSP